MLLPPRPVIETYYQSEDALVAVSEREETDLSYHVHRDAEKYGHLRADQVQMKNMMATQGYNLALLVRLVGVILIVLVLQGVVSPEMILKLLHIGA